MRILGRATAIGLAAFLAGACSPTAPTPAADTPSRSVPALPDTVALDPRWTAAVQWEPLQPAAGGPVHLGADGRTSLKGGVLAVADTLPLPIAFRPRPHPNLGTEFCDASAERDQLVLPVAMGCVVQLHIAVPDRIECAGSSPTPTAGELASAILANPRLGAIDLGPVRGSPVLPPHLFATPVDGRIVVIPGTARPFDGQTDNPDACRIPLEQTTIELRGDSDAFLILLDVEGRLVVIDLATGGHDRVTGTGSRNRGYATAVEGGDASTYRSVLDQLGDIAFGEPRLLP